MVDKVLNLFFCTLIIVFISLHFRQRSVDIEMKNHKIKTSFLSHEGPKAWSNKTGINFIIFINISEKFL